jgi:hypothetical protein
LRSNIVCRLTRSGARGGVSHEPPSVPRLLGRYCLGATLAALVGVAAVARGGAAGQGAAPAQAVRADRASLPAPNSLRNAYFGDLHLHTSMSFDAATAMTNTAPEDSYRFASGGTVNYLGHEVRRHTALDFLAVTDHAEYLGMVREAENPNGPFASTDWPKRLAGQGVRSMMHDWAASALRGSAPPVSEFLRPDLMRSNWQHEIDAAAKYYRPGVFTTFVAFEWSPTPGGHHLHRNVIFRGPKYPELPFSTFDSMRPEDLWRYADHLRSQGIDSVIVPHNSNLSGGLTFAYTDSAGNPIDRDYARTRMRNERLVEIAQNKGASETLPQLSPTDEFANFELMPLEGGDARRMAGGYVRQAFARGLEIQARIGVNPFAYGIEGGTDFHSGVSATEEANFPGGLGMNDSHDDPHKVLTEEEPILKAPAAVLSAGALTGVWAEQNTRESIFAALKRREAFATSGNRIAVRLFAGWRFPNGLTRRPDWVQTAYATGVPMGSDLPPRPGAKAQPRFLVWALKDPDSGNLDRIQIIKVWYAHGASHEKVFDVVASGGRVPDAQGYLPPVGNTVDVKTATYTNSIGTTQLLGEWSDPEFDPRANAIYYARVLEIPTPRWSTYLAVRNHLPLATAVPPALQERAWTSPVFYGP